MTLENGRYTGALYRALNPVYARTPLSGAGAALYGGRFNAKGTPALYTALTPTTALHEANQVGSLQPTVLVSYRANIGPIFDTRDLAALSGYQMTPETLADPSWRSLMLESKPVPTQTFADALLRDGFAGLLVRSFARGMTADALNLTLWNWETESCQLEVIDDEDRLHRM